MREVSFYKENTFSRVSQKYLFKILQKFLKSLGHPRHKVLLQHTDVLGGLSRGWICILKYEFNQLDIEDLKAFIMRTFYYNTPVG